MKHSENIAALAAALVKAQAQMSGAKKTAKNAFFNSSYSTLEEVINCVKKPLNDNGLFYAQELITEPGRAGAITIFLHESGEMFKLGKFTMKVAKDDPQGYASAFTYCRRISLKSACGLPDEDDDGNDASTPPKKAAPAKPAKPAPCTDVQKENINSLIAKAKLPSDLVEKGVSWASGGNASFVTDLTIPQAAKFIKFLSDKATVTK